MRNFINWLFDSVIGTAVNICIFISAVMMFALISGGVLPNIIRIIQEKKDEADENAEKKKKTQYIISASVSAAALIIPIYILVLAVEMKRQ